MLDKLAGFLDKMGIKMDLTKIDCRKCGELVPIQHILEHECIQPYTVRELREEHVGKDGGTITLFANDG